MRGSMGINARAHGDQRAGACETRLNAEETPRGADLADVEPTFIAPLEISRPAGRGATARAARADT
jgi:hypothetical protein